MRTADYFELVHTLSRSAFAARLPGCFLLKRPQRDAGIESSPNRFGFATATAKIEFDPFAREWQIVPVDKRPGNPFPEKVSVGRATNCDIVLRVPFVSKVHAYILRTGHDAFALQDNRPSNPTFHNREQLGPRESRALKVGDSIGFGQLEFEFVDAERLHDILQLALTQSVSE
jgi:FHA domain